MTQQPGSYHFEKNNGSIRTGFVYALRYVVAFALLSPLLLPATIWARVALVGDFSSLLVGKEFSYGRYIIAFFTLLIYLRSYRLSVLAPNHFRFCTLALALCLPIIFGTLAGKAGQGTECACICVSLLTGLAVTLLLGSPEATIITVVSVIGIQCCYAIYDYCYGSYRFISGDVVRAGGTFHQPNALSTITMLGVPVCIAFWWGGALRHWNAIGAFITGLMLLSLILTWNRGMILGAAVGLVYFFGSILSDNRLKVILCVAFSVTVMGVYAVRDHNDVSHGSVVRSTNGRTTIWRDSMLIFERHWLVGVGVGNFSVPFIIPEKKSKEIIYFQEPKSLYLYILDTQGTYGAIVSVLLATFFLQKLHESHSSVALGVLASFFSLLVAGLFDTIIGPANRSYSNVLAGVGLGIAMQIKSSRPIKRRIKSSQ